MKRFSSCIKFEIFVEILNVIILKENFNKGHRNIAYFLTRSNELSSSKYIKLITMSITIPIFQLYYFNLIPDFTVSSLNVHFVIETSWETPLGNSPNQHNVLFKFVMHNVLVFIFPEEMVRSCCGA